MKKYLHLSMPSQKIHFTEEDYEFMHDFKRVHDVSVQKFVTTALQLHIERIRVEKVLDEEQLYKK